MRWRGIVAGVFGLAVLQLLVSQPRASGAVGGVLAGAGNAIEWFLAPKPAFALKASTTAAHTTAATSSSSAMTASQLAALPPYTGPASVPAGTL